MASELVKSATSDKLKEFDWTKNIEICELVSRDKGQTRDVINAIKKRLGSKNSNTQLFAVMLLEMLMNNCGEHVHRQVIDNGVLPILVKIVKKKSDLPVREKVFLLLDATQTSLGGASGKFPQYYAAYYDLVCARVQFPQNAARVPSVSVTVKSNATKLPVRVPSPPRNVPVAQEPIPEIASVTDSSIIQKASTATEILREVLDALDPRHPEGATDEFTLDLVEQCSFQKQRVMHIAMTCRDEKLVSRAIELNEQLDKLLIRHDALLSVRSQPDTNTVHEEDEEVEEPDQLFRRLRKGKACISEQSENFVASRVSPEMLHRPLIRPLTVEAPLQNGYSPPNAAIPPPPAKHVEREKYFKEKQTDGALAGHIRHLSLHSSNGSSSRSGSIDLSE